MDQPPAADRFVGIDVSKGRVDVHVRPDGPRSPAPPTRKVWPTWSAAWRRCSRSWSRMEASGGYEGVVAAALAEAGLPVAIVNPRQVRKFAGAIGRLAKTDAIDAGVIAHFADAIRPAPRPMPDALMVRLRELLARRRQLVVMINAEKQRLAKAADKLAQRSFKTMLRSLEAERARIDRAIDKLIEDSPLLCAKQDLLKSVPGIGDVVARTLIAELPELGTRRSPPDRRPRRRRTDEPRQRPLSRQAKHPRRPRRGPRAALHGLPGRHPPQPAAAKLLPASARRRQTRPPRPRRRHAQAAHHPQRHAARQHGMGTPRPDRRSHGGHLRSWRAPAQGRQPPQAGARQRQP